MDLKKIFPLSSIDLSGTQAHREVDIEYFKYYGLEFDAQHFFGSITSISDCKKFEIACHVFHPESPRGSVFFIHGLHDHSGLSTKVIKTALDNNLSICVFDMPGHGLSSGEPASINSFGQYVDIFQQVIDKVSKVMPKPWHACAQSTGASVLMLYLRTINSDSLFQSYSLFSPLLRPYLWVFWKYPYYLLRNFLITRPRKFNKNSNDKNFLTFVENDPLQAKKLTVKWLNAMNAHYENFLNSDLCSTPLNVFQGTNDTTVDWKFNISTIKKVFLQADVFFIENARHHLVNESEEIRRQWEEKLQLIWAGGSKNK